MPPAPKKPRAKKPKPAAAAEATAEVAPAKVPEPPAEVAEPPAPKPKKARAKKQPKEAAPEQAAPKEAAPEQAAPEQAAPKNDEEVPSKESAKKSRKRKADGADEPKKPRAVSAYQLFLKKRSADARAQSADGKVPFAEFSKLTSTAWHALSEAESKCWYDEAKAVNDAVLGPKKPKEPLTSFFAFLAHYRKQHAGTSMSEPQKSKAASQEWHALSAEEREAWKKPHPQE